MAAFQRNPVTVLFAAFLVSAPALPAAFLRFQWQDNEGDKGEFVIDTAKGVSTDAFLSFSYIDYYGNPTPPGHLPKSWRLYDEDHVWDINPDLEGIVFTFSQPVGEPLPEDPAYYEDHFKKSVYLAEPGLRTRSTFRTRSIQDRCSDNANSFSSTLAGNLCASRQPATASRASNPCTKLGKICAFLMEIRADFILRSGSCFPTIRRHPRFPWPAFPSNPPLSARFS